MESVATHQTFGRYTTPRDQKSGARDIPFGKGAKSLYVDATTGNPHNDGESWITAVNTIQAAVDAASAWSDIFIKAGTYEEAVTVNTQKLTLLGERRASVIIAPPSGAALSIAADYCNVSSLTAQSATGTMSIYVTANRNILQYIGVAGNNLQCNGDWNEIHHLKVTSNVPYAVKILGDYNKVHDCFIDGAGIGIFGGTAKRSEVYDNEIRNCHQGIKMHAMTSDNSIYHNNLTNNTTQVRDNAAANKWSENFYDDHTTDTDHTGIADTAYAFTGGTDYKPVSQRNGWKLSSLGLVPT